MNSYLGSMYNNLAICSTAIWMTVCKTENLQLSKAFLIMPFLAHGELLNYLSHHSSEVKSIEELIAKKPIPFTNFNSRFYDLLTLSLNSIQFLVDIEVVKIEDGILYPIQHVNGVSEFGKRGKKIFKAIPQLCNILNCNSESLYLNLRVEL